MELRHLRYFVAVAERASFTAAARHLGMAQPPLSTQIRKLETEVGSALFHRANRRVELTAAGRGFLADAREILTRADQAVRRLQDEAAGRLGEITIAYSDGAFSEEITRRLRKFFRKHRGLRWHVQRQAPGAAVTADVFIQEYPANAIPAGAVLLESTEVRVVVPPKHRLADRAEIEAADLIGETLLAAPRERRSPAETLLIELLESQSLPVQLRDIDAPLVDRLWQISLGAGIGVCTSEDRGLLDARSPALRPALELATVLVVPPNSTAAATAALSEAIRASPPAVAPAPSIPPVDSGPRE